MREGRKKGGREVEVGSKGRGSERRGREKEGGKREERQLSKVGDFERRGN